MRTVNEALRRAVELSPVSDSPRLDVELLLSWVLGKERVWLYTWPETELSDAQQAEFDRALSRRRNGEPIAHIMGEREFWSLPLYVDASTLIPRPDSERLVELALALTESVPSGRALDLGTGTGALALAFASERPAWEVTALDASTAAIDLARRNARRLGLERVRCLHSDWYSALPMDERFELVMSNPPYIADCDPHLNRGDVRFEPRSALVAERQGLADIEHIVNLSPRHLLPGGWLLIEHGWEQGSAARELFTVRGFRAVRTEQDLNERDRVTLGQWPAEEVADDER
ncbi:peptide chain release factor N(5)-glutamine methyltransferase [Marinimicrobium sp. C6131]|uniref:peptide chain release factor N(5)-glutamine methyltransferase n=1 Tax=Marinimicrobium sp. C6131 TaxID=3022676 RepID=UPI00223E5EF3|nr:peptide chain release factor N(5)-glutamine methyltransferase [Marinimicrobium sp. C6131]UZJ46181.1 peptide chain release factor N(5)-glutamine methyltransferase [Marinimicrobium sp. C6131]